MRNIFQHTYHGSIRLAVLDWVGTTIDFGCFASGVVLVDVFMR